jgi:GSH-dependent disulfide-bond oxidoreductase
MRLYTWTTPNGLKPLILIEELAAQCEIIPVKIGEGEQRLPEFLSINPNGKIPALIDTVDGEALTLFESGAILLYLAEKFGQFLPASGA